MKYNAQFKNKEGVEFSVSSMDDYVDTPIDIADFTKVLNDASVRTYITDEAMAKYGHSTTESLSTDILLHSALRWQQESELRFLMRDSRGTAVGIAGITLKGKTEGELWYYKVSTTQPFMFEALSLVLNFVKTEGVKKLVAHFELDNLRSLHILEKLGFETSKPGEMFLNLAAK